MGRKRVGYWRWLWNCLRNMVIGITRLPYHPIVELLVGLALILFPLPLLPNLWVILLIILGFFVLTHGMYREGGGDC